jgi:hypothetical protein
LPGRFRDLFARISHKEHEGREDHKEEFSYLQYAHAQYDLCLKHLSVGQTGGPRTGKTQGESAYEPPAVSLRQGTPENVFPVRYPPACPTKNFIGHKSIPLIGIKISVFYQTTRQNSQTQLH